MILFGLFLFILIYLIYKNKKSMHMLQQNLYNENNRYLLWIKDNIKECFNKDYIVLILLIINMFINNKIINNLIYIVSGFILFILILDIKTKNKNFKTKKPLVVTSRVKRLIFTMCIIYLVPIVLYYNTNNYVFILVLSIFMVINYITLYICNIINKPFEKLVYFYYLSKAKRKLKMFDSLKVVGITGSYGKTSSKNILNDILNYEYNCLATPKNLNTNYGLMITINNYLTKFDDVFIAEMGAYTRGEIKSLCNFVKPKYGILTTIGTAHLKTFGSLENICKGKFELIESLPIDGVGVLNGDDEKQLNYKLKNKCKIVWIGINNHDTDIYADNIKCDNKGSKFDVIFKNNKTKYNFETKLLGKHNIYNILASIAIGIEMGIDINNLIKAVGSVKPIEHRLEIKKISNFYQIDDAYNSNPVGARGALDVLNMMDGTKVVVTPGMVELGQREDYYNKEFGKQISRVADYVILVGKNKTKPIYEGLVEEKYNLDNIIVTNDVVLAYNIIINLKQDGKKMYALFENDLPDTYNE